MPPSASDILILGNFCIIGDQSSSAAKIAVENGIECGITENGERGMKFGKPPKWNTATVPMSLHACHAGSHSSPWMSGFAEAVGLGVPRDGVATLLGDAVDLVRHPLRTEHEARQREWDEAPGVRAAPLVDVPVVVRAEHDLDELGVVVLQEELAAEARSTTGS